MYRRLAHVESEIHLFRVEGRDGRDKKKKKFFVSSIS